MRVNRKNLEPYVMGLIDDFGIEDSRKVPVEILLRWEDWMTSDEADEIVRMISKLYAVSLSPFDCDPEYISRSNSMSDRVMTTMNVDDAKVFTSRDDAELYARYYEKYFDDVNVVEI